MIDLYMGTSTARKIVEQVTGELTSLPDIVPAILQLSQRCDSFKKNIAYVVKSAPALFGRILKYFIPPNISLLCAGGDITQPVTSEKETRIPEKKLQQSQKMVSIDQLTGDPAHILNNTRLSIMGYTNIALGD